MLDKFEMCERNKWLGVEKWGRIGKEREGQKNRERKRGAEE